jgi:hypothetical protein
MQIVIYDKKTGVTTAASDNRGMGQSQVITVDIKPPTDK